MEHGKGQPRATKASFISGIPKIHHLKCGGRVYRFMWAQRWECSRCEQQWKQHTVDRWGDEECEIRFYLQGDIDHTAYVIVWKRDGKKEYSTLVPVAEADKHERFKL